MFGNYVFEKSSAQYANYILLLDDDDLNNRTNYISAFSAHGFEIVRYSDDLTFRIEYEERIRKAGDKIAVLAHSEQYIPYDMRCRMTAYKVALEGLFPKLHAESLQEMDKKDFDILTISYRDNYDDYRKKQETEVYLKKCVYSKVPVMLYLKLQLASLLDKCKSVRTYKEWFAIAEEKALLDMLAVQYDVDLDTQEINRFFQQYARTEFGKLSQNIDKNSPVLVSKAMDYMSSHSEKFIVIVMDGMSEFDWKIIATSFKNITYEKASMFAMIPSTTSISRQCLLAGKYPSQLLEPWRQSKEKAEFVSCAKTLGFTDVQIGYERGYGAEFGSFVRCGAVIINDVDDMVHAQTQGRLGMYNDISVLANQRKLQEMTQRFLNNGYDVYITADHGNTCCTGLGKLMGTGVEVETKSRRMLALKDFADKTSLIDKYGLIDYPKYYLPKEFDYVICDVGDSFDAKGNEVMTHGGITLDEVVVPFIKIKAV